MSGQHSTFHPILRGNRYTSQCEYSKYTTSITTYTHTPHSCCETLKQVESQLKLPVPCQNDMLTFQPANFSSHKCIPQKEHPQWLSKQRTLLKCPCRYSSIPTLSSEANIPTQGYQYPKVSIHTITECTEASGQKTHVETGIKLM